MSPHHSNPVITYTYKDRGQDPCEGDFVIFWGGAIHTVSCVAHSQMHDQFSYLHRVPPQWPRIRVTAQNVTSVKTLYTVINCLLYKLNEMLSYKWVCMYLLPAKTNIHRDDNVYLILGFHVVLSVLQSWRPIGCLPPCCWLH